MRQGMAQGIDEFDLIARYFEPLARDTPGALGLRDDAALIKPETGCELVVSADALVSGVHFSGERFSNPTRPEDIARRALRTNLSDMAAMGATPLGYTLTLQLPGDTDETWLTAFAAGLARDQAEFGVGLLGGDTTRTPGPLSLSINIFGQVLENKCIKRSGAHDSDDIYVSGTIGDSALGLALECDDLEVTDSDDRAELIARYRLPEPRVGLGVGLVGQAHAAADVSDGLVADLGHICSASGLMAEIVFSDIPLSSAARRLVTDNQPLHLSLLSGGEDFELVFAAPVSARESLREIARDCGVSITRIGRLASRGEGGPLVSVLDDTGQRLEVGDGGYRHFGKTVPR